MGKKRTKKNMTETKEFICGFALGVTEMYRQREDAESARSACSAAGLSISEFIKARVPDYDMETLEEIFKVEE